MNRLIIIGNGFDLAHGMETSYKDFICELLFNAFSNAKQSGIHRDELIIVKHNSGDHFYFDKDTEPIEYLKFNKSNYTVPNEGKDILKHFAKDSHTIEYSLFIRYEFLNHLITCCINKNWVDIENEYYNSLIKIRGFAKGDKLPVKLVNEALDKLIKYLKDYISKQKVKSRIDYLSSPIYNLLIQPIKYSKFVTITQKDIEAIMLTHSANPNSDFKRKSVLPEKTHILNFNYTYTIRDYLANYFQSNDAPNRPVINNIHGTYDEEIIFGFGDEIDEEYKQLEKENDNNFLQHIKSFSYFKNENLQNLIRFIDSDMYEIFIWGHSCGLSDRTMLNMIFAHSNCKSIKIFHHKFSDKENNFTTLTQEISRHFNDKSDMRRKIVSYNKLDYMPQIK